MILSMLMLAQTAPAPTSGPVAPAPDVARYEKCIDLAVSSPAAGEQEAVSWRLAGGGYLAQQCIGMAYATQKKWQAAADAFEDAARAAELAHEPRAPNYWAQAGNAWAAQGNYGRALAALDAALAGGSLAGLDRGEALLDRARVKVAGGDEAGARADLDGAIMDADRDPLAWLLSATLARRMNDLSLARLHIAKALALAADDASVQLEAGNIAAASGNEDGAKTAWREVVRIAPLSTAGRAAEAALAQFDAPPAP